MTDSDRSDRPARRAHSRWPGPLVLAIATTSVLVATPVVAQASSTRAPSAAATCAKVSTASVAAIVGHHLPAPTAATYDVKASKQNDEISTVEMSCTYGAETLAALPKDVVLEYGVASRSLTAAEYKKGLAQAQTLHMTIVSYSGLGVPAFYYSFAIGGITAQGIGAIIGTKEYGGFTYAKSTSKSQLASLVRLAEKL